MEHNLMVFTLYINNNNNNIFSLKDPGGPERIYIFNTILTHFNLF